jgi:tetratricopeptide (TPR) repeat protein
MRTEDPSVCGRLALVITEMLERVGPDTKLVAVATDALEVVTGKHPALDAELRIKRGMAAIRLGNAEDADRDAQMSLRIVKKLKDPLLQGLALGLQGRIAHFNSDWNACLRLAEKTVNLFKKARSRRWLAIGLCNVAQTLSSLGRMDEKDLVMNTALDVARSVGDRVSEARCVSGLAFSAESRGEWDEAHKLRLESLALYEEQRDIEGVFFQTLHLGTLALACERFDEAADRYGSALELAKRAGNARGVTLALSATGLLALSRGDLTRAHDLFQKAEERFQSVTPYRHLQGFVYAAWATLFAETERIDEAHDLLTGARERLVRDETHQSPLILICAAHIHILEARTVRAEGDLERAASMRQMSAQGLALDCDGKDAIVARRRLERAIEAYDANA